MVTRQQGGRNGCGSARWACLLPGTRVLASKRHQPAFSQMTRTALTVLVLLLVSSATSWAVSNDHALPPPSLDDEFNSLSLHYRPTGRDIWGLIAPRTPNGRGGPNWFEGDTHMWWTNPFNPKTPVNGLYTAAEGRLRLGLMPTPPAYQSWINSSAGIHMPFVGTLLYSVQKQRYGYFEIRASVDAVSGLTFQACLETGDVAFPFEIDIILFTSSDGSQHVKFDIATRKGWPSTEVRGIDITQMHTYAIEWTLTTITWYIDGIERWSRPSPGGNYDIYPALWYLLDGRGLRRQRYRSQSGPIARLCACRLGPQLVIQPVRGCRPGQGQSQPATRLISRSLLLSNWSCPRRLRAVSMVGSSRAGSDLQCTYRSHPTPNEAGLRPTVRNFPKRILSRSHGI